MSAIPLQDYAPGVDGLFRMSEEAYRPADGINQSLLKYMLRSPKHCRDAMDNPKPSSPAMELGTQVHELVLRKNPMDMLGYCVRPETRENGEPWDRRIKECKEWEKNRAAELIVDRRAVAVRDAVYAHPSSASLLNSVDAWEVAAFVSHSQTGLTRKGKIDAMAIDGDGVCWVIDLKTTDDVSLLRFERTVEQQHYDLQAAYYLDMLDDIGIEKATRWAWIAVEKEPPHDVVVYVAGPRLIEHGRDKWQMALRRFADCGRANKWPGVSDEILILEARQ